MTPQVEPRRRGSLAILLLLVLALAPYANSLRGDFVFDDLGVVRDNPLVQSAPPWRLFTTLHQPGSLYRPLTMLTYAANARIDRSPVGFHVVNAALHAAVTLVLFALFRALAPPSAAWIAAALFAVHPVHCEAVASIVGRAELLAALASLLSLLALQRALRAGRRAGLWWSFSLAAFAVGLLCKESAFTLLLLVPIIHWRLAPGDDLGRRLRALLPYALVGVAYLSLRILVVGSLALPEPPDPLDNPIATAALATRLRTAVVVLWDYLAILVAPIRLSADYSFNQIPSAESWSDPRFLLAAALLSGLAAAALAAWRRWPEMTVAAAFFALPLALTANLLFPIGTIKGERLLYLPSAGACLAAGLLLAAALRSHRRAAAAFLGVALVLLAARTWARNLDWRDARSLFASAVDVSPDSAKAHYNLAVALQAQGRLDDALAHYRRTQEILPSSPGAAYGIGQIAMLRGDATAALQWFGTAAHRDPQFANAYFQIGLLRQRQHEPAAAEAAFSAALRQRPDDPLLLVNLAAARLAQGKRDGAREALDDLDATAPSGDPATAQTVAAARREIEVAMQ